MFIRITNAPEEKRVEKILFIYIKNYLQTCVYFEHDRLIYAN